MDAPDRASLRDTVTLVHPGGDRVTLHVPMDAHRFGLLLQTLGPLGFEFEFEDQRQHG